MSKLCHRGAHQQEVALSLRLSTVKLSELQPQENMVTVFASIPFLYFSDEPGSFPYSVHPHPDAGELGWSNMQGGTTEPAVVRGSAELPALAGGTGAPGKANGSAHRSHQEKRDAAQLRLQGRT